MMIITGTNIIASTTGYTIATIISKISSSALASKVTIMDGIKITKEIMLEITKLFLDVFLSFRKIKSAINMNNGAAK